MRPSCAALLRGCSVPCMLITDPVHVRYITGVQASSGVVLADSRGYTLFVDGRYTEAAAESLQPDCRLRSRDDLASALKRKRTVGIEDAQITVSVLAKWKKKYPSIKFVHASGFLEECRRSKSPDELRLFKRSQRITRALMEQVQLLLTPGITERELAATLWLHAVRLGAEEWAFDPIVAFGSHTSRPHHHPTSRALRARDIVQIDTGVRVAGYCSDQSRVFFVGSPTAEQQRVHACVQQAKVQAESLVKAGASIRSIDECVHQVLQAEGLDDYFTHSTGHGVGLEIHEGPVVSVHAEDDYLRKGEIITVEPGVYLPGRFGIRLEDEWVAY